MTTANRGGDTMRPFGVQAHLCALEKEKQGTTDPVRKDDLANIQTLIRAIHTPAPESDGEDAFPECDPELEAELVAAIGQLTFQFEPVMALDQIRPEVLWRLSERPDEFVSERWLAAALGIHNEPTHVARLTRTMEQLRRERLVLPGGRFGGPREHRLNPKPNLEWAALERKIHIDRCHVTILHNQDQISAIKRHASPEEYKDLPYPYPQTEKMRQRQLKVCRENIRIALEDIVQLEVYEGILDGEDEDVE